jgi:hypothetical protein
MFFIKEKSRFNGKEFIYLTHNTQFLIYWVVVLLVVSVIIVVGFVLAKYFLSLLIQYRNLTFFALVALFFILIRDVLKNEPKDYCSSAFIQLKDRMDVYEQAGVPTEILNPIRIQINLQLAKIDDFHRGNVHKKCYFQDKFYSEMRSFIRQMDNNIFVAAN